MDSQRFLLTLPAFTLWMPEGPSPYILRGGGMMMYPVFTDEDSVITYRKRQNIGGISIRKFSSGAELRSYLVNPPTPDGKGCPEVKHVIFDPMSDEQKYTIWALSDLVASLEKAE